MNDSCHSSFTDAALVERSAAGDRDAFAALIERHQGAVWGVAYGLSCDEHLAADIAQETFLIAWSSLARLEESSRARAWLCGIARNLVRSNRRKISATLYDDDDVPDDGPDQEAVAAASEEREVLFEALGDLAPHYREALSLFYFSDKSVREVAESLDVSEEVVRKRLSRGRQLLRHSVEPRLASNADRLRPTAAFGAAVLALIAAGKSAAAGASAAVEASSTPSAAGGARSTPGSRSHATAASRGPRIAGLLAGAAAVGAVAIVVATASRGKRATEGSSESTSAKVAGVPNRAAGNGAPERASGGAEHRFGDDERGGLLLRGIVIDAFGTPMASASIVVSTRPQRTVSTDEAGRFEITGLMDRSYQAVATSGQKSSEPTAVSPGDDPAVLVVENTNEVELHIIDQITGQPLSGASATVIAGGTGDLLSAQSDGDGIARLRGVPAGWPAIRVSAPGYGTHHLSTPLRADPGTPQRLDVALSPGIPVRGHVIDPDGQAITGAEVQAIPASRSSSSVLPSTVDRTYTGDDGEFFFEGLPPGSYRFMALHKLFQPGASAIEVIDTESQIAVHLETGGEIVGKVQRDGQPVEGAVIETNYDESDLYPGNPPLAVTDASGIFRIAGLPKGRATVRARSGDGAASETVDVLLEGKQSVELALSPKNITRIRGFAVDHHGTPLSAARVHLRCMGRSWSIVNADGDGRFSATLAADGSGCRGTATARGWPTWRLLAHGAKVPAAVDIEEHTDSARVPLAPTGVVTGRLLYADGTPASTFELDGLLSVLRVETNDGWFRVELPASELRVVIRLDGREILKQLALVEPDAETDLGVIRAPGTERITGVVVDESGTPIVGATVVAGRFLMADGRKLVPNTLFGWQNGFQTTAVTDSRGRFEIVRNRSDDDSSGPMVAAEHPIYGRSPGVRSASGNALRLVLEVPGSLRGSIDVEGADRLDRATAEDEESGTSFSVAIGADGQFRFDRLTPGTYLVRVRGQNAKSKELGTAEVRSGEETIFAAETSFQPGSIALTVNGCGPEDVLLAGVSSSPVSSITDMRGAGQIRPAINCKTRFADLEPGSYHVCVWLVDREAVREGATMDDQKPSCTEVKVRDGETAATVAAAVDPA